MKLYWSPRTRASRVVWMLEEAQVSYDRVRIEINDEDAKADPAFRAASPMGKVPALEDGEVRMADSAAICIYVADKYPASGLAPGINDPARGQYLYWMFYTPGVIEPCMAEKISGVEPNPGRNGWGSFNAMISTLENGLQSGPWLLGDRFSAADVMVGSSATFLKMFGLLPESSQIEAYIERCLARPAYKSALALDAAGATGAAGES